MNQTTQHQHQERVKTKKKMKKLLILTLLMFWAFVSTKAQNNFFITSVQDVRVSERGSGLLTNQLLIDTSEVATSQRLWFLSPKGYDPGTGRWFQSGMLNVNVKNLSSTLWKKVSLYDFTGINLLYTNNLAPNAEFNWDFDNGKRLDASKDYYWKIEDISPQGVICRGNLKDIPASSFDYIDVLDNDLNLPVGADCRLKAGQSLTGGITVTKDQYTGLKVTTSSQQGSFSFVYEAVSNTGVVLGEATVTVTVGNPSQYCTLAILSEQLLLGSQTIHEFTLYSPNAQINPFEYTVRIDSYSGTIVKSGTTAPATSNKELIDFGTLPTGTYYVTFSSTVSQCFDLRMVSHVEPSQSCNVSIISINKVNGTNNYNVNGAFSDVSSVKVYLVNAETSTGKQLLTQSITSPNFSLDLSSLPTNVYFLNFEGEGKYCKAQKDFEHTLITASSGQKLDTWTKLIHNYRDNWIISGKNDYESGRDKFGLQSFTEKATNVVWKAFISEFENLGNSPKAKAIIGFRKDTTRNEVGVSVAITPNSIILQQRSSKSGLTNTVATISGITSPVWVRLTKTGNDLLAEYSKDLSMNPVYQELGRITGAFTGFTTYQKYIGVASAKTDVVASARFQGFLGGTVNFTAPTVTINPPSIASNVVSPTSGQSITLSTATACVAPATNKWYKNNESVSFSAGSSVNVQAFHSDSYYSRCENGLNRSVKSNVILFNITNLVTCNNGNQAFEVLSVVYSNGSITFSFNASNLTNTNWSVLNGSTITKTATLQPSASTQTVSINTLTSGNYLFKLDGISCSGSAQKAFTVSGSSTAPVITSVPSSPKQGDNIVLTATGCVGNYNWYSSGASQAYATNSGSSSVSSVIGGLYYYATCVGQAAPSNYINVASPISQGETSIGTVPDLTISTPTLWNYFNIDEIPDFAPARSLDAKTGQFLPNKGFIWHAPYRNLFGINDSEYTRLERMTKKGVTAWNTSKLPPYSQSIASIVTPDRIVSENYGLGENGGNPHPEEASYNAFLNWGRGGVANALAYGVAPINGKYGHLMTISDYENLHTNLTTQIASNYHTVALNGMADIAIGRVGFQYGLGLNTGGYYTSNLYAGSNNVWALPANNLVPSDFVGKSSASNNRIVGVNEITYAYETFLPEGYQVQDQNNNNWFTIKHFGAELDNTYNGGNLNGCNAQHWATNVGVGTETAYQVHKSYPNGGQDVVIQLKPVNETDNGYHYDQRFAVNRGNKYANYVNRYAITNTNGGTEYLQAPGSEYVTPFIAEGQVVLAYFSGAKFINFWSSDFSDIAIPKSKIGNPRRGAKYNDVNYGNRDLESYSYTFKALWRLNQKVTLSNGQQYSFNEICDGTEVYLNQNTKVVYPGSASITQLRALDWQLLKRSPVRAVVNQAKNVVFVLAFQAYGVEDATVTFKLTDYGANISETINLPQGKIVIKAYPLTTAVSDNGTIIAPTVTKNVATPTNGQSVTLTSSGCQSGFTNRWYDNQEGNLLASGLTFTVNAINGDGYYAKCVNSNGSSLASNIITFTISSGSNNITIVEPNKPQYFFSNNQPPSHYNNINNLPLIFTNANDYDAVNDLVWLKNDKVKFAINLKRGGQIAWASLIDATANLVYNGYDGGFQIQMDAYQRPDGYTQNGKYSRARYNATGQFSADPNFSDANGVIPLASYNVTQGGDFNNHSQSLIDYRRVGTNGYYIKLRPIFYTFDAEHSRTYIEVTYTLDGYSLKCDYTYTSFRNDGQYTGGGFDAGHAPVCFLVNNLTKYKSYTGNNPWTRDNAGIEDGILPNQTAGQSNTGTPLTKNSKERWALVYNPNNNNTIGVYANTTDNENSFVLKQFEVYDANGRNGGEFNGGFTILGRNYDLVPFLSTFDRTNFSKTISSELIVTPNQETFINEVYRKSGH